MNKNQQSLSPRDMHMGVTEGEDTEGSWGRKEGTVTKTWLRNSQRQEGTDHLTKNEHRHQTLWRARDSQKSSMVKRHHTQGMLSTAEQRGKTVTKAKMGLYHVKSIHLPGKW